MRRLAALDVGCRRHLSRPFSEEKMAIPIALHFSSLATLTVY